MAYERNGFLEGIDGAARLMGIYHGIRDRQDRREQVQKEWDYKVGRDKVADEHWQKTFEQNKLNQDRNYELTKSHYKNSESLALAKHNREVKKEQRENYSAKRLFEALNSGLTPTQDQVNSTVLEDAFHKFGGKLPPDAPTGGDFSAVKVGDDRYELHYSKNYKTEDGADQTYSHILNPGGLDRNSVSSMLKQVGVTDDLLPGIFGDKVQVQASKDKLASMVPQDVSNNLTEAKDGLNRHNFLSPKWAIESNKNLVDFRQKQYDEAIADAQKTLDTEATDARTKAATQKLNDILRQGAKNKLTGAKAKQTLADLGNIYADLPKDLQAVALESAEALRYAQGSGGSLSSASTLADVTSAYKNAKKEVDAVNKGKLKALTDSAEQNAKNDMPMSSEQLSKAIDNDFNESVFKSTKDDPTRNHRATQLAREIYKDIGVATFGSYYDLGRKMDVKATVAQAIRLGIDNPKTALIATARGVLSDGGERLSEAELHNLKEVGEKISQLPESLITPWVINKTIDHINKNGMQLTTENYKNVAVLYQGKGGRP